MSDRPRLPLDLVRIPGRSRVCSVVPRQVVRRRTRPGTFQRGENVPFLAFDELLGGRTPSSIRIELVKPIRRRPVVTSNSGVRSVRASPIGRPCGGSPARERSAFRRRQRAVRIGPPRRPSWSVTVRRRRRHPIDGLGGYAARYSVPQAEACARSTIVASTPAAANAARYQYLRLIVPLLLQPIGTTTSCRRRKSGRTDVSSAILHERGERAYVAATRPGRAGARPLAHRTAFCDVTINTLWARPMSSAPSVRDDSGDRVANQIRERPGACHEPVDTEQQCSPAIGISEWSRRGREGDESAA